MIHQRRAFSRAAPQFPPPTERYPAMLGSKVAGAGKRKKKKRLKEWSLAFRTQQKGEFFRSRRHGSFFCKPQWLNSGHARVDFVIAQSERVWRMKASPNRQTGWRFRRDQVRTGGCCGEKVAPLARVRTVVFCFGLRFNGLVGMRRIKRWCCCQECLHVLYSM